MSDTTKDRALAVIATLRGKPTTTWEAIADARVPANEVPAHACGNDAARAMRSAGDVIETAFAFGRLDDPEGDPIEAIVDRWQAAEAALSTAINDCDSYVREPAKALSRVSLAARTVLPDDPRDVTRFALLDLRLVLVNVRFAMRSAVIAACACAGAEEPDGLRLHR